jgi:hypothetical protein
VPNQWCKPQRFAQAARLRKQAARPLGEVWAYERELGGERFVERYVKRGHLVPSSREDSGPGPRAHPSFG